MPDSTETVRALIGPVRAWMVELRDAAAAWEADVVDSAAGKPAPSKQENINTFMRVLTALNGLSICWEQLGLASGVLLPPNTVLTKIPAGDLGGPNA